MRYIFKELSRHKWRTFFSIAGYAIAALFITTILCVNGSDKNDSFGILKSTGTHFIVYIPTDTVCCSACQSSGTVFAEGVLTLLLDKNILQTIKNTEGVRDAAPCLLYKMYCDRFSTDISISGIDTASIATRSNVCARTNLIAGRYLSPDKDKVVAEQSFATAHKLSVGDTLDIFGTRLVLAGIINSGIKPVKADFYAPIENVRSILKKNQLCTSDPEMNIILVEVSDARIQDKVMSRIKNMMYNFAVSSYNCYEPAYKVMAIIEKSSVGLTILIFLFLVIYSAKTQASVLAERFREIGILKSLGWSDFRLSLNIIAGSLIQSVSGVTLGLFIGAGMIGLLNKTSVPVFQFIQFHFRYTSIPVIYLLAITGAMIASILPVLKIYSTRPGDIIKNYM